MRILSLRFKNLNSLEGVWNIDFTAQQFRQNGLFVITGPTGSGKTTILDAIALAMYGRTPRLPRINKTTNDIMTQGCGECFSEVTFSTTTGTYRSLFSQRRARGLAAGMLQDQKREISDAVTGKIIASTLKEAETSIEHITGMNFDQFTRSVMLAQGQFAAFLQAGSDQRAPILEQITGTAIYSEISIAVQQRYKEEKDHLASLQSEVEGLQLLTAGETISTEREIGSLTIKANEFKRRISLAEHAQRWYADQKDTEHRERQFLESLKKLHEDETGFTQGRALLSRYETARPLLAGWKELQVLETNQNESKKEATELEVSIRLQEELVEQAKTAQDVAAAFYNETLTQANSLADTIRQVRGQDAKIVHAQQDTDVREAAVASYEVEQASAQAALTDLKNRIEEIGRELEEAETYLRANGRYAELSDILELLFDRIDTIQAYSEHLSQLQKRRENQSLGVSSQAEKLEEHSSALSDIVQAHANQKATCATLQKELQELTDGVHAESVHEKSRELSDAISQAKEDLNLARQYEKFLIDKTLTVAKQQQAEQKLQILENSIATQRQLVQALDGELSLAIQNRNLAQYRDKLERGLPCPLCGSLEHPYAKIAGHSTPDTDILPVNAEETANQLDAAKMRLEESLREKGQMEAVSQNLVDELLSLRTEIEKAQAHFGTMISDEPSFAQEPASIVSHYEATLARLKGEQGRLQTDIMRQERLNRELSDARSALDALNDRMSEAREAQSEETNKLQQEKQVLQHTDEEIKQVSDSMNDKISELRKTCGESGINLPEDFPTDSSVSRLKQTLQSNCDEYRTQETRRNDAAKRLAAEEGKLEGASHLLKQSEDRLSAARRDFLAAGTYLDTLRKERLTVFGAKDCDVEEATMQRRLDEAQSAVNRAKEQLNGTTTTRTSLFDRLVALRKKCEGQQNILDDKQDAFRRELANRGFSSREDFQDALLSDQELKRLQDRAEILKGQRLRLESEHQELERQKRELDAQTPQPPYDIETKVEVLLSESRNDYEESLRQIGSLQQKLESDEALRKRQETVIQAIETRRRQLQVWDSLYALIGSSDGKKFRNYAQGITFDMLLAQSNRKLTSMTDRYLLVRSQQEALDIAVIDNYQAGEIRSTKNLSGGESFLISLALALGLSQMASKQVRVDSLFLDEGFGTLDAQTLDTALDALSTLRDDGKLIGLISHVPALRERITTQIEIIKGTGGKSTLIGPGCKHLD